MAVCVSRETERRLDCYASLIRRWNGTVNLVSRNLLDRLEDEIKASYELIKHIPCTATCALDIGSGNGLPAVPISLARDLQYELVEPDTRKAVFLREVGRQTGALIQISNVRIEHLPAKPYDLITSRAFAPLETLVRLAWARQRAHTVCVFPKGARFRSELLKAQESWRFEAEQHALGTGFTIIVRNIEPRTDRA